MSSLPRDVPAANLFRYGWRFVPRVLPDGRTELERVPLTLEDVLHPKEGDVIPERTLHEKERAYLAGVFRSRPPAEPVVHVTFDCLIDWGVEGLRDTSPDVAVFAGLREGPDLDAGTFHLLPSGGRCLLTVELVSPDTRENDVVRKVEEYYQAGVPLYLIVDQEREGGPRRLIVYRSGPQRFEEVPLDEHGRFRLAAFQLWVSVREGRVVCHDVETGRELGDYAQISRELDALDQRCREQEQLIEDSILRARADQQARLAAERLAQEREEARLAAEQREREANDRIRQLEEALRRLQPPAVPPGECPAAPAS
jgi:Uma2 family endonuclease